MNRKEENCAMLPRCNFYYGGCLGDPNELSCYQEKKVEVKS